MTCTLKVHSFSLQDNDSELPNGHSNPHKPGIIPPGVFRGGDEVPPGTFRGGDEVPPGTFRGGDGVPPGTFRGGDEVPPGTFRGKVIYRTRDGQADYGFSIERQPSGNHRVYIEAQPSYQGRSSDGHSTHRYTEGGRNFIYWTEPVRSESEAKQVAAKWADSTQSYIKRGENF